MGFGWTFFLKQKLHTENKEHWQSVEIMFYLTSIQLKL